ncbi:hypothetical protein G5I_05945 [Acromyrmex echinatior]|uniref:Uncharacterized protein n=1 Tax=Acromyrmex echinatior TaxID=103372 RepID=F4WJR3_ACREC|nr:hypothetical protein G5I_05945 [Acromyrmex echinatior]
MTKGIPALAFVRKPARRLSSFGMYPSGILNDLNTSGQTSLSTAVRAAAVHNASFSFSIAFDKTELDEAVRYQSKGVKVRFYDGHWKPIVDRSHYSAVGMAADSADTSLLTSAIEEDPTESPNAIHIGRSEILHLHCHHHHPRSKDVPRKCRRDQNGALLCDFDEISDFAYKQREASDSLLKFVTDIPPNAPIINVLLINVSYMSSVVAIKCSFGYEYIVHPRTKRLNTEEVEDCTNNLIGTLCLDNLQLVECRTKYKGAMVTQSMS